MSKLKPILCLFFCWATFSLINFAYARDCQPVYIAADPQWPPYYIKTPLGTSGVSVDIMSKVFSELDISVQYYEIANVRNAQHALQLGDIDILLTTYDAEELDQTLDVIRPGFIEDPLYIMMRRGKGIEVTQWDDLIGMRGVITNTFAFDRKFEDFKNRYLYVQSKGPLDDVLSLVENRKADYLVGSMNQLNYLSQHLDSSRDLEVVPLHNAVDVHVAFSKKGACRGYYPYVRKRLKDLKDDGTIDRIAAKYAQDKVG